MMVRVVLICNQPANINIKEKVIASSYAGEKKYSGALCGFRTARKYYLNIHMKMHGGEMNYSCALCGFRTVHNYYLNIHMNSHWREELPLSLIWF
jgi:hypothetical protein